MRQFIFYSLLELKLPYDPVCSSRLLVGYLFGRLAGQSVDRLVVGSVIIS